jgi:hypothetical protein
MWLQERLSMDDESLNKLVASETPASPWPEENRVHTKAHVASREICIENDERRRLSACQANSSYK